MTPAVAQLVKDITAVLVRAARPKRVSNVYYEAAQEGKVLYEAA